MISDLEVAALLSEGRMPTPEEMLEVQWLCRPCHRIADRERQASASPRRYNDPICRF